MTSPKRRRRLQFSLRSLLAAMLLVPLGFWVYGIYVRPYAVQAEAIAVIQDHGGSVSTTLGATPWLREFEEKLCIASITHRIDLRVIVGLQAEATELSAEVRVEC